MFAGKSSLFIMVAIMAVFAWYQAEAQYVQNGLVGYWPFDSSTISGTTARDVVGGHDGMINFPVKIVPGKVGDALEFPGENLASVVTDLMITEAQFASLTMMAWVKPAMPHDAWGQVMGCDDGGWDRGYGYRADDWEIQVGKGGEWQPGAKALIGEWRHTVCIYTPTNVIFYLNGERFEFGERTVPTTSVNPLMFGDDIPCGPNCSFPGPIDEILVYGRELSDAEVQQNFTSGPAAVRPADKLSLSWGAIKALR